MVFRRLLGSLGVGGPTVDTVLEGLPARPGGMLHGQVRLRGGAAGHAIEHVTLELVARVENEHLGEDEVTHDHVFERATVGGGFRLPEESGHSLPFAVALPWETPMTELYGQHLGLTLGIRTELGVEGAKDSSDLDSLPVAALPAQEAVLRALGDLGFTFASADLEKGHIRGTGQKLPFYQEIELHPAPRYAAALNQLEVTFLAGPDGVEVVLEADQRIGGDALNLHRVRHEGVEHRDVTTEVDGWVRDLLRR
ncbi:sporulation protein [Streptomyces sp. WMMC1477]|uniref:sporulation protein n=1 Tax=unclassified Streptomyces TaxID=2593676 RepID=UPI003FCEB062